MSTTIRNTVNIKISYIIQKLLITNEVSIYKLQIIFSDDIKIFDEQEIIGIAKDLDILNYMSDPDFRKEIPNFNNNIKIKIKDFNNISECEIEKLKLIIEHNCD